ncbi:MAG: hypothetical protein FWD58_07815 [Firmicutes bacterium]|nr:hypothetical protein [Bacillota bacterium]
MEYEDFLPYIEVKSGLSRLMNNKKLYASLLKKYLASTDFASMAEPLASGELEVAREKIHTFKGVSSNLSIAQNFELSRELEAIVKEQGDWTEKLAELKASMDATIPAIGRLVALFEAG